MTASKQAQGLKSFPPEGGGFYQKGDYKNVEGEHPKNELIFKQCTIKAVQR